MISQCHNSFLARALAILSGLVVTIIVQSSTPATVLIVPMAGAGIFTLAQVYPFSLGAKIGTPITALMSATAISGEYRVSAMQIALVHVLCNGLGVLLFCAFRPSAISPCALPRPCLMERGVLHGLIQPASLAFSF
jgi:Na+/phosphate symporter